MSKVFEAFGGVIRWQAGETRSEVFQLGDGVLFSIFMPATGIPTGPYTVEGAINREADFRGPIEDEANTIITIAPTVDRWFSLDDSLAEVAPFHHLWLVSSGAAGGLYEARYVAKRP